MSGYATTALYECPKHGLIHRDMTRPAHANPDRRACNITRHPDEWDPDRFDCGHHLEEREMITGYAKQCQGCDAMLAPSDPDLCGLCEIPGHPDNTINRCPRCGRRTRPDKPGDCCWDAWAEVHHRLLVG